MDELDHRILRELGSGQILLWGGLDPGISAGDLAARLGVDRSTVRLRMRAWEKCGFLRGFQALPNVGLFGLSLCAAGVRVDDISRKPRAMQDLELVDGCLSAMEHVGEWIGLAMVDDGPGGVSRRLKLLERLPGVVEVQPAMRHTVPACTLAPTPLQWRILQALRASGPRAPLSALAKRVGVSPNTFRAHYDALVAGKAIWSVPELDFTHYTGAILARLVLTLASGTARAQALGLLREAVPGVMEHPSPEGPFLSVHVQAPSMGALEEIVLAARGLPGVEDVEVLHPRRFRVYANGIDERVADLVRLTRR